MSRYGLLRNTNQYKPSQWSQTITSWQWDFGDGIDTTYTTFIDTITNTYTIPDTYTVI